jgi:hypothetical protein
MWDEALLYTSIGIVILSLIIAFWLMFSALSFENDVDDDVEGEEDA